MKARLLCLSVALAALTVACSKSSAPEQNPSSPATPTAPSTPVSTNKNDYPVFPNADAGADPSVPAEQGGKGFDGKGWETNTDFDLIGDPHAIKGGVLHDWVADFPGTLRQAGPEYNSGFNYGISSMAYETLLGTDFTTLDYIPALATHWKVSPDKMTFWFRINPNARFSDGTPVTSDDIVATYDFMMDKTLQDPSNIMTFGKLERPVAESKYIVHVHAKELNWRNLLYFAGMEIFPAHILKTINGDKYIKEYNYKMLPGSGPYIIQEADVEKGKSITVRRRKDYWAAKARANVGLYNFDEMRFVVVRDETLAFEMFKKGDLDYYGALSARQWVQETDFDNVKRGLIQKRRIYNNTPEGFAGIAFNTHRQPFDDIRVRKAFTLLLDRKKLIEKIMFNQYEPLNSYFVNGPYENPNNPKNEFDPQAALKLLADAGWKDHDSQGRLVKNGQPLEVELLYDVKTFEPHLTVYQEDLRKVGIAANLRLVTPETDFQILMQRKFQMAYTGWGALLFPNPETSFHSSLADVDNNNDITGFKDPRVDALCKQYDVTFSVPERENIIRQIDGIVANSYQYALMWYAPYQRIIYWNKFGIPRGYLSRTGDLTGAGNGPGLPQMWWVDSSKDANLQKAIKDSSVKLEAGTTDDRYWLDVTSKLEGSQSQSSKPQ